MPTEQVSFHSISAEKALAALKSSPDGLTSSDASARIAVYGPNILPERKKKSLFSMFIGEFKDFVILLLIAAAIISAIASYFSPEPEYIDSVAIIAIVIINAVIGVYQEFKAGKAIEALRKLVQPKAKVLRLGKEMEVNTSELVPGDIILLHEGDKVPADGRIIEAHNLELQEASLTGESHPVSKTPQVVLDAKVVVNERRNMVFMSTLVTKGSGKAVVCYTGEKTQIGRISDLVQTIESEETPLQIKLSGLGKQLGKLAIAAVGIVFIVGIGRAYVGNSLDFKTAMDFFLIAVSLAVAAIPEGLPAVVTISLAIGVQRMAKRNSIIRRLPAAEGLGSSTVICSDKTGTLTKNEMTVRRLYVNSQIYEVTGQGYVKDGKILDSSGKDLNVPKNGGALSEMLQAGVLCNNAALSGSDAGRSVIGDPTEACLLVLGEKAGIDYFEERKRHRKLEELSFDSSRKMMTAIFDEEEAGVIAYTKGAPEMVLEKCSSVLVNGKVVTLSVATKREILKKNADFASGGLRILGFALRQLKQGRKLKFTIPVVETDMVFLGLAAMMDPPREEVREAISLCKKAGIRAVMITGDNELTAKAIAAELGMFKEGVNRFLTGRQLEEMPDSEFDGIVESVTVYARVSPE
ncbi:MAG: HAD-IC family P-type ATPase, partial [Candidatus Micrarchaeota archaeon]